MKHNGLNLKAILHKQTIRWAIIGFILTSILSVGVVIYYTKISSQRQVSLLATSATAAYRRMILNGDVRLAQLQITEAFKLRNNESVIILDKDFKQIYSNSGSIQEPTCHNENKYCWSPGFTLIETLYPIYFDEHNEFLFGYLDFKIRPTIDWTMCFMLLTLILFGFAIQALGLTSAIGNSAQAIGNQLDKWTTLLRKKSIKRAENENGLILLEQASNDLHKEIEKIKKVAANDAKSAAQLNILKELGHDLKTPISQIDKFINILFLNLKAGKKIDAELISYISSSLSRIKDIARQTGVLVTNVEEEKSYCNLEFETKRIINDLKNDAEILSKKININLDHVDQRLVPAFVTPGAYYRIVDNLLRNAIHAVPKNGKINLKLKNNNGNPEIVIKDNGQGISPDILERIFDFDFTTKPSRGTGMGLGIVKKLCSLFGAKIDFNSELNKGAEFTVTFQSNDKNRSFREVQSASC